LSLREETPKIVVNDLFPIEQVYKLITGMSINLSGLRENLFESLKELLSSSHGRIPSTCTWILLRAQGCRW